MRSPRLSYRPIDARDAGRVALLAGDWDVARMTSRIPHPYSLIDADLWIASIGNDEFVRGVERDGELIGAVGYISGEPGRLKSAIGSANRGGATATPRKRQARSWAIVSTSAGFRRLNCGHFIDNLASARVIKKLGFRRIGSGAQWCEARNSEVATVKYARGRPLLSRWRSSAR